ncbi:hypothetical protein BD779DRAFT_1666745 [Infundibulicybe gibba]|nr:hypothetical protein BD779DRAFT_1666745 [Infundibulicybe gibba]
MATPFHHIIRTSHDLLAAIQVKSPPAPHQRHTVNPNVPKIPSLPSPTEIVDKLLERTFSPAIVQQISPLFHSAANTLYASACQTPILFMENYLNVPGESQKSSEASMERIIQTFHDHYNATLQKMLHSNVERARRFLDAQKDGKSQTAKPNRGFNQEYRPLLEKYFESNPYPSALDRALLARKSMMTARQIEVWFQNHRNRARKEGRIVRRIPPSEQSPQIPLELLEEKIPSFIIPAHERMENYKEDSSQVESDDEVNNTTVPLTFGLQSQDSNPLDMSAPPHAFPTTFKEAIKYTTFISKSNHFSCSSIDWMRKPALPSRKRKVPIDVDDLCNDFMGKLSLHGPVSKKLKRNADGSTLPWFAYKQVTPTSAPHPALIQSLYNIAPISRTHSSNPAPSRTTHQRVFQSPPLGAPSTTSLSQQNSTSGLRKIAHMPKRIPKHGSINHRGISPTVSDTASSASSHISPSSSRISSFNSSASSRRRLSSSSCSSAASSTPTTPAMMFMELPEMQPSFVSSNCSFGSDHYEDLFGDESSSLIRKYQSFSPGPRKLPFNYDFSSSPNAQVPSP